MGKANLKLATMQPIDELDADMEKAVAEAGNLAAGEARTAALRPYQHLVESTINGFTGSIENARKNEAALLEEQARLASLIAENLHDLNQVRSFINMLELTCASAPRDGAGRG